MRNKINFVFSTLIGCLVYRTMQGWSAPADRTGDSNPHPPKEPAMNTITTEEMLATYPAQTEVELLKTIGAMGGILRSRDLTPAEIGKNWIVQ